MDTEFMAKIALQSNEESMIFSISAAGSTGYSVGYPNGKMKPYPYFTTHTKTNSSWVVKLNMKDKIMKFLKDNLEEYLHDPGERKISRTQKHYKEKIGKLEYIKIKLHH